MGRADAGRFDETSEAVCEVGEAEACREVGRAARAGLIPRGHRELVRKRVELRPPQARVPGRTVNQHQRGTLARPLVGDRYPVVPEAGWHGRGHVARNPELTSALMCTMTLRK
jgi:hypothetical protein